MSELKAVAKAEDVSVPMAQAMEETGISASDLIIPKLHLMQNTSELVGEGKAKLGDVVNLQTMEVVGGFEKKVEVIPLKLYKTWVIYDMSGPKAKYARQEPVTPGNENLPWEDKENGIPIRRDFTINFYVLLKDDVAKEEAFPIVISFKRTSLQAGKQMATQVFKMAALGKPSYNQTLLLGVSKEKKDTNYYGVFECSKGNLTSEVEKAAAKHWLAMVNSMKYKVDDSDLKATAEAVAQAPIVVGGDESDLPF